MKKTVVLFLIMTQSHLHAAQHYFPHEILQKSPEDLLLDLVRLEQEDIADYHIKELDYRMNEVQEIRDFAEYLSKQGTNINATTKLLNTIAARGEKELLRTIATDKIKRGVNTKIKPDTNITLQQLQTLLKPFYK